MWEGWSVESVCHKALWKGSWFDRYSNKQLHRYCATIKPCSKRISQSGSGSNNKNTISPVMKLTLPGNSGVRISLQRKWCSTWACVGIDVSSPLCNRAYKLFRPSTLTLRQLCQIHQVLCGCFAAVRQLSSQSLPRGLAKPDVDRRCDSVPSGVNFQFSTETSQD